MTTDLIRPGAVWLDTDGKPIQAHGGSILDVDWRDEWSIDEFD